MQYLEIFIAALLLALALYLFARSLRSKSRGECTSCSGCQTKCPDEQTDSILLLKK